MVSAKSGRLLKITRGMDCASLTEKTSTPKLADMSLRGNHDRCHTPHGLSRIQPCTLPLSAMGAVTSLSRCIIFSKHSAPRSTSVTASLAFFLGDLNCRQTELPAEMLLCDAMMVMTSDVTPFTDKTTSLLCANSVCVCASFTPLWLVNGQACLHLRSSV